MTGEQSAEGQPPPIVFTVRYTQRDCLFSAWRFWQRRLGKRYALELLIGLGLIVLATQGPYRWLETALFVVVAIFAFIGVAILLIHWLRALNNLKALDPPESTWTLTQEAIAQKSSLGESALPWQGLLGVWRFPEVWLLIWGRDVYSTIPVAQLPREARDMIERRTQETGGRVI